MHYQHQAEQWDVELGLNHHRNPTQYWLNIDSLVDM